MKNFAICILALSLLKLSGCGGASGGTGAPPISSTPLQAGSPIDFGSIPVGSLSPQESVTFTNTTNTSLTFSTTPSISGTNAGDFAIAQSTCSTATPLAAGATCLVFVTLTPSTQGSKTASLAFSTSAGSVSVSLTGVGVVIVTNAVALRVSPESNSYTNIIYADITICEPNTSNCQTIPNIIIDTGSTGLRIVSSALSLSLAQMVNNSGDAIANCVQFADLKYAFGPVVTADIKMAGETALAQPIQILGKPGFPAAPSGSNGCVVSGGTELRDTESMGGNGILGIGLFKQDCGAACQSIAIPARYYRCAGGSCSPTTVTVANQLQNPAAHFSINNNGIKITMPSIGASGAATANGTMFFGIGTQSNNALGSATIYKANANGLISTTYNSTTYPSFIDSGSNGVFFLSSALTGLPNCSPVGFYCPASTTTINVTNTGTNSASGPVSFNVANANTLFNNNPSFDAFNNLGGPFANYFDFGLSFFYGRSIYFGIEGKVTGAETGPFYAY